MMKKDLFVGAATALITPFANGKVDYAAFGKLIDWQIEEGIAALVIAGTTGEASTLDDAEHRAVISYAVKRVAGRVPVIAGAGSNDTAYAVSMAKFCAEAGADGLLLVTPYYNKATQRGLIESFSAIADAAALPSIVYNVPSRTGCNILPETAAVLAEHEWIWGIKEASGNISQIAETARLTEGKMTLYSGNDDQILPVLSLGGKGVISVLSNVFPARTQAICRNWFEGKFDLAMQEQLRLLPLVKALFSEVNPIPVKSAMAHLGFCENSLRLPLTQMDKAKEEVLLSEMRKEGLKV